jgi:hypothetical protein
MLMLLGKLGYTDVQLVVNGRQCVDVVMAQATGAQFVQVILMSV